VRLVFGTLTCEEFPVSLNPLMLLQYSPSQSCPGRFILQMCRSTTPRPPSVGDFESSAGLQHLFRLLRSKFDFAFEHFVLPKCVPSVSPHSSISNRYDKQIDIRTILTDFAVVDGELLSLLNHQNFAIFNCASTPAKCEFRAAPLFTIT
jgi:hypothetical protein